MYKGIYIATSGAIAKSVELMFRTRNIANSSTVGYKKEDVIFGSFPLPSATPVAERVMKNTQAIITTDYSHGSIINTGNPLDLALSGDGFFVLEGEKYTRRGDFKLDSEGFLVNKDGIKVLGQGNQPIQLPPGRIEIGPDGTIIVNGTLVGRLKIVDFEKPYQLLRLGDSIYVPQAGETPQEVNTRVIQGSVEGANVNVISEMVRMIESMREFEAYQKMIRAFDESTQKAINEIGRI